MKQISWKRVGCGQRAHAVPEGSRFALCGISGFLFDVFLADEADKRCKTCVRKLATPKDFTKPRNCGSI